MIPAGIMASRPAAGGGGGLPLDAYTTGLAGAWSMTRRLLTSYTGPLFRVETSDTGNAQTDIGYDGSNVTNETALLAAITGANDGRTVTIYDQSGLGRNITWQSTKTRCVVGGVVQKSGNRIVTKVSPGVSGGFETAAFTAYTGATISGYVGRDLATTSQTAELCATTAGVLAWANAASVQLIYSPAGVSVNGYRTPTGNLIASPVAVTTGFWVVGARINGSNYFVNYDGSETTGVATSGSFNIDRLLVGADGVGGSGTMNAGDLLSEAAVWFSDLGTANLNAVVLNHKTFMAPAALPLDALTSGLVVAASPHRRLLTSYTGPLIQVQRTTPDTTTLDIGYDGNNKLDEAAISTFCGGSGDGRVLRIYLQDGSGNYARPSNGNGMIYQAGVFSKSGNIPVIKTATGTDGSYQVPISITTSAASAYTGRSFGNNDSGQSNVFGFANSGGWVYFGTDSGYLYKDGTNLAVKGGRNNAVVTSPITVGSGFFVAGMRLTGTNMVIHAADTTQSGASTGTLATVTVMQGAAHTSNGSETTDTNALLGELVIWNIDIGSTAQTAAQANYAAFMAS